MRHLALFALVLGLVACRDSGGGDDTQTPDGSTNTDDVTIQEIQNDSTPECDPANPATCTPFGVRGVVVTAIDSFGADTDVFWVQEPDGGPFSGVKVYGASVDQRAALAPGDIVDIEGAVKDEFACEPCMKPDTSGRSITELKNAPGGQLTITKKGSGTVPQPAAVDALAIGMMESDARDAEWEKWEGVLISLSNVTQTGAIREGTDPDDNEFRITGGLRVQSALAELPANAAANDCYASITGIGEYFFDWILLPRSAADFGGAGAGCPAAETACTDGLDNDGNGFKDCADFSCQSTEPTCVSKPTIEAIQKGEATGPVELTDVYVVTLHFNKKQLWVSSSPAAAANQGIYVFRGTSAAVLDDNMFVPGAKVTVKGVVQENNNDSNGDTLTQIGASPTVTFVAAPGATDTPTPVMNMTAADLVVAATGEPYESVLVTLTNVKVTVQGTNAGFYVGELDQNGTKFYSDDDIFRLLDPVNTCYASITGIWSYNVFSNSYGLLPTTAPTPGGTCN